MELKLMEWYYTKHNKLGQTIKVKEFKEQAKKFSTDQSFLASKGWLEKFKKRYQITLSLK